MPSNISSPRYLPVLVVSLCVVCTCARLLSAPARGFSAVFPCRGFSAAHALIKNKTQQSIRLCAAVLRLLDVCTEFAADDDGAFCLIDLFGDMGMRNSKELEGGCSLLTRRSHFEGLASAGHHRAERPIRG